MHVNSHRNFDDYYIPNGSNVGIGDNVTFTCEASGSNGPFGLINREGVDIKF